MNKRCLKRAILIIQILCICMMSICGCSSKADETETETTQAETMLQLDTTQMPLLYSFETGFGPVVEVYQIKAVHRFRYDDHIYSLVFSVDGENQFIADIIYYTKPIGALESTPFYQGNLRKEEFISSSSLPTRDPNGVLVLNKGSFYIDIYKYERLFRLLYDDNEFTERYVFSYTFDNDGPKLWTNLKEEDITIINENLTVTFAE